MTAYAYEMLIAEQAEEDGIRVEMGRTSVDGLSQAFREPQRKHTNIAADDPRLTPIASEADYRALLATDKYTRPPTAEEIEQQRLSGIQSMIRQLEMQVSSIRKKATLDVFGIDTEFAQAEAAAVAVKGGSAKAHELAVVEALGEYYGMSVEEAANHIIDDRAPALHELINSTAALLWKARAALKSGGSIEAIQEQLNAIKAAL